MVHRRFHCRCECESDLKTLDDVMTAVVVVVVAAVGFRNLCGCDGHGQFDHSIYGGQNVHVLTAAARASSGGGCGSGGGGGGQQICRSASTRSFTFSTKI